MLAPSGSRGWAGSPLYPSQVASSLALHGFRSAMMRMWIFELLIVFRMHACWPCSLRRMNCMHLCCTLGEFWPAGCVAFGHPWLSAWTSAADLLYAIWTISTSSYFISSKETKSSIIFLWTKRMICHAPLIRLPPSMSDQEYSQAGWSASVNCAWAFSSHTML
jgi:hypothetical protein